MRQDTIIEGTVFGAYTALIIMGTLFFAFAISLFTMPDHYIQLRSYHLGLLSFGFSFIIALFTYLKFRVNFNFDFIRKKWGEDNG